VPTRSQYTLNMLPEDAKNEHKHDHKPSHPQFRSLFVDESNFCFLNHISPLSAQVLSGCEGAKDPGTDAANSADDESASSFVLLSCSPEAQQQQRSQQSHIHNNNVKSSTAPPNDNDYYLTLQQQKYNAKLSSGDLQIDTIGYGSSQLLNCSSSGGGAGQSSTATASILSSDAAAASSLFDANELWSNGAKSGERAWSKILLPEHTFFDIPELDHYSSLLDDTASLHRQRSLAEDDDHDPFHPNKQHTHHHHLHSYAAYHQRPAASFASTGATVAAAAAEKHTPQILVESHLLSECIRSLGSSPDATAACPTTASSSSATPSTHNDHNNKSIGNGDQVKNAEFFIPVDLERHGQHNKAAGDKDHNSTNGTATSLDRSTAAASHNAKNINSKSSAYDTTGQENRSLMKDLALSLDAAASRYTSQNFGARGGVARSSLSQEIKNSSLENSYYHIQSAFQKQPKRDEKANCEFNLSTSAVTLKPSKEFPPECSTQNYHTTRNSVPRPQNLKQLDCCPAAVSELNKFSTTLSSNPTTSATHGNQLQHLAASKAQNLLTCDHCRQTLNASPNQNQPRLPNPSSTNFSCSHQISSETKSIPQQPKLYSYCTFCKNNGESEAIYSTHYLKDSNGVVTCPILRAYTCPICGQNGDKAHTVKYCPIAARLSPKDAPVRSEMRVLRTARTSAGRRRFY